MIRAAAAGGMCDAPIWLLVCWRRLLPEFLLPACCRVLSCQPPSLRPLQNLPRASDIKPQPRQEVPTAREAKAKNAQQELQKELAKTRVVPGRQPELMRDRVRRQSTAPLPKPASFGDKQLTVGFLHRLGRVQLFFAGAEPAKSRLGDAAMGASGQREAGRKSAGRMNCSDPQAIKALNLIREKRPRPFDHSHGAKPDG